MITKDEIQELLHSTETYRVERTTSTGDMDKFQEAICAFANDMPNSRKKGYLILGAHDNGELSGLKVTDDLLKKIAAIRSNGNILPIPVMSVESFTFPEGDLLVADVVPEDCEPENVVLRVCNSRFNYIKTKPLHSSWDIIEENEDDTIISITVKINKELESLILSFGSDIEVLSPVGFRARIADKIKVMNQKYNHI